MTRPRLLVFNQYYWPAVEATAHLLTELCEDLATDAFDVTVVTGAAPAAARARSRRNGVRIVRVASTTYERRRLSLRGLNYLTYVTLALREGIRADRPDVILCLTDPPFLGNVAHLVARRFRAPYVVVSMDVFPEIALELKRLKNPLLVGLLRQLVRFYLRRANRIVAIGETMRGRLIAKGADAARITVIPNWVDTSKISPAPKRNDWAKAQGLDSHFVVMHSGNVGHAQDLDTLIRAATLLRDLDDLRVVIIGMGARHQELVRLAQRVEADAVRFLPYQPREVLSWSLSAADVHVVGLASGLSGYVVPSRVYGVLAVARPVIVAADDTSETAQLVRRAGCGVVVPPGRPDLLARAIRDAYEERSALETMGRRARQWVEAEADRRVAVAQYARLLGDLVVQRARDSTEAAIPSGRQA